MASYNSSLKDWGATGSEYPTGYTYEEGEQPVDAWDNFLTYHLINDVKQHLIPLTNQRVESESGTSLPASPESTHLFGDTGTGKYHVYDNNNSNWRELLYADGPVLAGAMDLSGHKIEDTSGNITLVGDVEASRVYYTANGTWFDGGHSSLVGIQSDQHHVRPSPGDRLEEDANNNFNLVDGAGSGVDADTVDGEHASAFADATHYHDGRYVNLSGGETMSGDLDMGGNQVKNTSNLAEDSKGERFADSVTNAPGTSGYETYSTYTIPADEDFFAAGIYIYSNADSGNPKVRVVFNWEDGTTSNVVSEGIGTSRRVGPEELSGMSGKSISSIEFQYDRSLGDGDFKWRVGGWSLVR